MKQMTLAEAKAEGLLPGSKGVKVAKKRTTQHHAPRAGARSHCVSHDEWFESDVSENRHVNALHGCRIEGEIV